MEVYLKNEGYNIYKFYTGQEALECIKTQNLNLALLDVMLPDIDYEDQWIHDYRTNILGEKDDEWIYSLAR